MAQTASSALSSGHRFLRTLLVALTTTATLNCTDGGGTIGQPDVTRGEEPSVRVDFEGPDMGVADGHVEPSVDALTYDVRDASGSAEEMVLGYDAWVDPMADLENDLSRSGAVDWVEETPIADGCAWRDPSFADVVRFQSSRHPDTINTDGPYPIEVVQLGGGLMESGVIHYEAVCSSAPSITGVAELERLSDDRWSGEIPGQAAGCDVVYYFQFSDGETSDWRYPTSAPDARFRFRIVPFQIDSFQPVPRQVEPSVLGNELSISISSPTSATGVVWYRIAPETAFDRSVPLTHVASEGPVQRFAAALPAEAYEDIVDYFIEWSLGDHFATYPADAPARFFTYKVSSVRILNLVTGGRSVRAFAQSTDGFLLGMDGGGLVVAPHDGSEPSRFTIQDGLPSGIISSVDFDPVAERLYVASENGGAFVFHTGEQRTEFLTHYLFGAAASGDLEDIHSMPSAALISHSTLDGSVLIAHQMRSGSAPDGHRIFRLHDDQVQEIVFSTGGLEVVGVDDVVFDENSGCFWFAGMVPRGVSGIDLGYPAIVSFCGDEVTIQNIALTEATLPNVTIAFDPFLSVPIVALAPYYGETEIYFWMDEELVPAIDERIPDQVNDIAVNELTGEILLGTRRSGIFVIDRDGLRCASESCEPGPAVNHVVQWASGSCHAFYNGSRDGLNMTNTARERQQLFSDFLDRWSNSASFWLSDYHPETGRWVLRSPSGMGAVDVSETGDISVERWHDLDAAQSISVDGVFDVVGDRLCTARHWTVSHTAALICLSADGEATELASGDGLGASFNRIGRHPLTNHLWLVSGSWLQVFDVTTDTSIQTWDFGGNGEMAYIPFRDRMWVSLSGGLYEMDEDGSQERLLNGSLQSIGPNETVVVRHPPFEITRWNERRGQFENFYYQGFYPRREQDISVPRISSRHRILAEPTRDRYHYATFGSGLQSLDMSAVESISGDEYRLTHPAVLRNSEDGFPLSVTHLDYDIETGLFLWGSEEGLLVFEMP